ncbi:MAG: phosphosulfolactate synthase [Bacteroidales bacterium]|nr:phosphosulfolactate synthase [Bacteroidales bacterium]
MNYSLPFLPKRGSKPRDKGIAMVMDKGLSYREADNLIASAGHLIDYIKLGFGTSIATNGLRDKIALYHEAGIRVYLGGTLFEAFIIRDMYDDFVNLLNKYDLQTVEVSDGSMKLDHNKKCAYISDLATRFEVLSEVGAKDSEVELKKEDWIDEMTKELEAGSQLVIAEARESGTVGIYTKDGYANTGLIEDIHQQIPENKILWEAPAKAQQAWFIEHFGAHVNLGNIAPHEVIALETLRLGLRGDTFFEFLPPELKKQYDLR